MAKRTTKATTKKRDPEAGLPTALKSKSAIVRELLMGGLKSNADIKAAGKKNYNVDLSDPTIYQAKASVGKRRNRRRKSGSVGNGRVATGRLGNGRANGMTLESLLAAKKFVDAAGGAAKAKQALDALARLA